ncbi:hypothetical protein BBJ29_000851 [Phytophthora kernoviae]|uniref:PUB domain-containing protein n=1 Tax=Phytophthora kernoviae TaxID=325452 RepID=A0A3F2S3P3_9STRA|nr:hypothetical protein BBJ29_000851 [Phytophthora kernoviae]RLN69125.1 hypothetical protein BBP00_00000567 [Phytophthora kernoviae]
MEWLKKKKDEAKQAAAKISNKRTAFRGDGNDPPRAISAAETLIKMLGNVVKNPQEEKFRKIRLSNAAIQSKLVAVPGAVDILTEAGFSKLELDGEVYLMLAADVFQVERVQSAIDRTEVALIQLQHDLA